MEWNQERGGQIEKTNPEGRGVAVKDAETGTCNAEMEGKVKVQRLGL